MDFTHDLRLREIQEVVVTLEVMRMIGELPATKFLLGKIVVLDHGAHSSIEHKNPLIEQLLEKCSRIWSGHDIVHQSIWLASASFVDGLSPSVWHMANVRSARLSV